MYAGRVAREEHESVTGLVSRYGQAVADRVRGGVLPSRVSRGKWSRTRPTAPSWTAGRDRLAARRPHDRALRRRMRAIEQALGLSRE